MRQEPFFANGLPVESVQELASLLEDLPKRSLALTGEGEDAQRDNDTRAGWAARALIAYAKHLNEASLAEELETVVGDLLGDLRHLCDALQVDWDIVANRSELYYLAEIAGTL
ncbi:MULTISPECIES: hypothetical protein [Mycobacterium]|uniref:Uncharacterized protein n=2 Tax=Mycobacterium TaxID=1763 RepID=A0A1X1Y1K0_9MYCO|nr:MULTISPECIES: hypothetical protein [Mycobacterium]MBZ4631370.1 hypothetical protein [Mycobacterium avium subsp. hominissuis]ORW04870.1 hypothetical protein AWC14_02325 [Mycobacterium kyorinense]PBJ41615.1 hypothetical protein XV03_00075 [Mycobacterium avium subsp. hominissuis]PBJ66411.1 hypothetical protein BB737_07715 [Mycobacterium avium subsp. hominissuis]QWY65421.1 hypothetical protein BJP78_27560 [Mycobacterium avium subsp. hominissuis]